MKIRFFCKKCNWFQEIDEIRFGFAGIRQQDIGCSIILRCGHRIFIRLNLPKTLLKEVSES